MYDEAEWEFDELSPEFEFEFDGEGESPFSEEEEMELAAELLTLSSEEELDYFLGKVFKKAWKGIKKVGRKVIRPLGGVLKAVAKKALPVVGGALGSFIPIPGVGTAVGTALGSAVGKALEMELEGLSEEDREFELSKRFVRLAGIAARQAAQTPSNVHPMAAVRTALTTAAQQMQQESSWGRGASYSGARYSGARYSDSRHSGSRRSGRWVRRGRTIILHGV